MMYHGSDIMITFNTRLKCFDVQYFHHGDIRAPGTNSFPNLELAERFVTRHREYIESLERGRDWMKSKQEEPMSEDEKYIERIGA